MNEAEITGFCIKSYVQVRRTLALNGIKKNYARKQTLANVCEGWYCGQSSTLSGTHVDFVCKTKDEPYLSKWF